LLSLNDCGSQIRCLLCCLNPLWLDDILLVWHDERFMFFLLICFIIIMHVYLVNQEPIRSQMPNLFVTLGLATVANLLYLPLVADQEMKDRSTNGRFQSVGSDLIPAHESYRSSSRLTRTQAGVPSSSVSWLHLLPLAPSFLLL